MLQDKLQHRRLRGEDLHSCAGEELEELKAAHGACIVGRGCREEHCREGLGRELRQRLRDETEFCEGFNVCCACEVVLEQSLELVHLETARR